ncbi:hypothetical protein [uncultured Algibacter sp.]|uniref:hypothetical protein n=1 Tax=uncultured Algibacter sp. TaxID=298659 RepID=UPI00260AD395|nr:hypothetical protein [uncultured Algibacter sp.]
MIFFSDLVKSIFITKSFKSPDLDHLTKLPFIEIILKSPSSLTIPYFSRYKNSWFLYPFSSKEKAQLQPTNPDGYPFITDHVLDSLLILALSLQE